MRQRGRRNKNVALFPGTGGQETDLQGTIVRLRPFLIHTRELLDGKDFLFSGPPAEIRGMLSLIVESEQRSPLGLHCVFTQIDTYFLLRMQGPENRQHDIASYFDAGGSGSR